MKINELWLMTAFVEYNNLYFYGILPIPEFGIMHGCRTLGYFSVQRDAPIGLTEKIEITDFYDYTDEEFRDVMVHEMVHYYLYYTGEDTRIRHGKAFKKMARWLNSIYDLNITKNIDISHMKAHEDARWLSRLFFRYVYAA